MFEDLGKLVTWVGSGADCEVRLSGSNVQPRHARIVAENGKLFFENGTGPSTCGGQPLPPNGRAEFDFSNEFKVGEVAVPLAHPAIVQMLMARGELALQPGTLTVGRDPSRCHVVLRHPNVSGRHATLTSNPLAVTDHGSTSGTWTNRQRLSANQPHPVDANTVLAIGPVPLPVGLALRLMGEAPAARPATGQAPQQGTSAMSGVSAPQTGEQSSRRHRTILGQMAMTGSAQQTQSIGRTPNNDIVLPQPQVSSRHALIHHVGGKLFIEDAGSANGTFVRGQRIPAGQRVAVSPGEKVFIGPMPLLLHAQESSQEIAVVVEDQKGDWEGRPLYEIEAWDLCLQVPDRDNPRELKTLLDHVSFKAMPGDFIALMGPSGAGKTTLLLALNGYLPPTAGQVRINGEDLYSIYDALRGSIGYVPQDDIVHPELTVWEAVRYSAKFRLPPDFSEEEIDKRVETTLQQLGLESVKHLQIGAPEKKVLSGGQRKRVNIAMELVTDPVLMFLDEPTSGLAADDTTALVSLLAGLAKSTGKTIVTTIHQPAKAEFEKFNLCLIMGPGGIPMFYGPTHPDAYKFFGTERVRHGQPNDVNNPRDMFDMINLRERAVFEEEKRANPSAARFPARQKAARLWSSEYFEQQHPTFQKMYSGARAIGSGTTGHALPSGRPKTRGQFGLLLSRYAKIKFRDKAGIWIMLLQAPIIGFLLALVFGWQKDSIPFWCLGALQELSKKSAETQLGEGTADLLRSMQSTPDHAGAIFFVVVAAVWFGTSNAAREVVAERAIYLRERMVNLGLFNYIFSKFAFLSVVCAFQCAVLYAIVFFTLGLNGGISALLMGIAMLTVTAMNSTALGLLLSTLVVSAEAAMALTPIALIPQVVLGGLMVPMTTNPLLQWPMYVMPARWGFQGVIAEERKAIVDQPAWVIDLKRPTLSSIDNFIEAGHFKCAQAQMASTELNGAWGFTNYHLQWLPFAVLGVMMLFTLLVVLGLLKGRDRI